MKNLIRWEDGVGCGVRGSAWFNCLQAWKEKSESIHLHVDLEKPFFFLEWKGEEHVGRENKKRFFFTSMSIPEENA